MCPDFEDKTPSVIVFMDLAKSSFEREKAGNGMEALLYDKMMVGRLKPIQEIREDSLHPSMVSAAIVLSIALTEEHTVIYFYILY